MEMPKNAAMVRIFTEEAAKDGNTPLFESIVLKARKFQLAGATVLRGPLGFGESRRLHNENILNLSFNLPIVIEIVDAEEKLREFCKTLDNLNDIGLVTIEKVEVLHYGRTSRHKLGS